MWYAYCNRSGRLVASAADKPRCEELASKWETRQGFQFSNEYQGEYLGALTTDSSSKEEAQSVPRS